MSQTCTHGADCPIPGHPNTLHGKIYPEWYLATCEDCTPVLGQPFTDQTERDRWAAHVRGTGHRVTLDPAPERPALPAAPSHGKGPWAVVLTSHDRYDVVAGWGPIYDWDEASQFCQYVTREIDPAKIVTLLSPAGELLAWRDSVGLPAVQALDRLGIVPADPNEKEATPHAPESDPGGPPGR